MKSPLLASLSAILLFSSGPSTDAAICLPVAESASPSTLADAAAPKLKTFLHSIKDTYGWQPVKGTISFDFFKDGRLHVQGPDGEATMWEGKWSLKGDKLTITYDGKTKTYTATIDGDDLLLDEARYKRYKPE